MRSCAFVVALLVVAQPISSVAVQSRDAWVNARTANFNIVSNGNERDIRRAAVKLEEFVEVVSRLFNARSAAKGPVTVMAFRDDRSMRPFKPLYNGKPANASGWFQRRGDDMLIALDINAATEERPFAVIFHEYTHLLTSGAGPAWPAWLGEGLAEFYSSFETQGSEARLGAPIAEHVMLLRDVPMIPLPDLFAVDHQSPTYNEGQRQNIFYAESWALVHYLMLGNKASRQPQLRQFIQALSQGTNVDTAFRQSFQTDYPRIETEVRSYVSRQAYRDYAAAKASLESTLATAGGNDAIDVRRMLTQIENEMATATPQVLVLSVRGKPVRFSIAPRLRLFWPSTASPVSMSCGPLNRSATVYFTGGSDPVLQGEAAVVVFDR